MLLLILALKVLVENMASSGRGGLGIFEMPNPFDSTFATFYPPFVAAPLQMEGVPLRDGSPLSVQP